MPAPAPLHQTLYARRSETPPRLTALLCRLQQLRQQFHRKKFLCPAPALCLAHLPTDFTHLFFNGLSRHPCITAGNQLAGGALQHGQKLLIFTLASNIRRNEVIDLVDNHLWGEIPFHVPAPPELCEKLVKIGRIVIRGKVQEILILFRRELLQRYLRLVKDVLDERLSLLTLIVEHGQMVPGSA